MNRFWIVFGLAVAMAPGFSAFGQGQVPSAHALKTRWAADVNPQSPLPEYPRPQFERQRWLNLNGPWQWAPARKGEPAPAGKELKRTIVVPFAVESALSGVAEFHERLWYRRTFEIPAGWEGQHIQLNFGAVDWQAEVYINGQKVGEHQGGYDPFSFDITPMVTPGGVQEIIVGVYDPTNGAEEQPRGKQIKNPHGIWYTPTTGIWQTVWIEPVPAAGLAGYHIEPDLAMGVFKVRVDQMEGDGGDGDSVKVRVKADGKTVQEHTSRPGTPFVLKPGKPRLWSPEDPFLYEIEIEHIRGGETIDVIKSYAGMRAVGLGKDSKGRTVLTLNGEPYFQVGPLDQGFWPDGLYTAPTDEALRYDIEITKQLGFNMTRKHVKVEPARWYYWADKLGLLVWQDMPSAGPYIGPGDPDAKRSKESAGHYERELKAMIHALRNHPSIIMWVPFNEGWGQYDTARIAKWTKELDPSRLVNATSGWADRGVGDVHDWHKYPEPGSPDPEPARAAVLGEYGGLGLPVPGHLWKKDHWGYKGMRDAAQLTRTYEQYMRDVHALKESKGLSAVVYTQITDVEVEANGLLTYDRAVIKTDVERIAAVNRGDFSRVPPPPTVNVVVPTARTQASEWKYTYDTPAEGWMTTSFDDAAWKAGKGGFGTTGTPNAHVGTQWAGKSIWLRKTFTLDKSPSPALQLRVHHDEDCEIYINGVLALKAPGYTTDYEDFAIAPEARAALKVGENTLAVVCTQTGGGQYIDAGFVEVIETPAKKEIPKAQNALPPDAHAVPQPGASVIRNGDFEASSKEGPVAWNRSAWSGEGQTKYAASGGENAHVVISSDAGGDLAWSTTVPVEMQSTYRLSGRIRTACVKTLHGGKGALLNVHGVQGAQTRALTGDNDWTDVSIDFQTGYNDSVMINCLFGGWGQASGAASYDDIRLVLVARGAIPAPSITVDAAKVAAPISKYIYGQFIEHMGRCIYGGIWAEMLEDRKFCDAVGSESSPWRHIGSGSVTMSTDSPFVGVHTPVITLAGDGTGGGIVQGDIGVRAGGEYVGYAWLCGDGPVGDVTIRLTAPAWAPGVHEFHITGVGGAYARHEFRFSIPTDAKVDEPASLSISASGKGHVKIGTVSLMPADNVQGFRRDTLALLKELDAPVYRWPGGNFVSGYDWRDGIGDRDRRPPRKNPAWTGIEHNDVGIHEFMALVKLLETEPYIAINTGLGSVKNAADELEYVNGDPGSPMGRFRASNGQNAPWGVRFWGIGNEMYGDWQLGHIPLGQYVARHKEFVDALRKVDPSIITIGVGAAGPWSRTMLRDAADHMDHISEHVYWQDRPGLIAHVKQAPDSLAAIAQEHRKYRRELESLKGRDIRIVQDEWNYWYGPHIFGELGTRYSMKDALGVAAALHEFARNSDIYFMANYAQTVNVIGAIKTTDTAAALESTGLVLKLYRHHLGDTPVRTQAGELLDALAAWSTDSSTLTLAVVNPTTRALDVPVTIEHARWSPGPVKCYRIASPDPMAFNDPGSPQAIRIEEYEVDQSSSLHLVPCSVTLFKLPMKKAG